MNKKSILLIVVLLLSVGSAFAGTGTANIKNTPHNLSYLSYPADSLYVYAAWNASEDQICIYCHTPHGGNLDAPLWNRDSSTLQGVGHYQSYSGAVMATLGIATNREINTESLLCLSCHDGSLGVGDIINNPATGIPSNSGVKIVGGFGNPGPRIGGSSANTADTTDLRDDHPISFSYQAVYAADTSKLQDVATVEGNSLTLFGGAAKNVECATCHDPHVDYFAAPEYTPFWAIPNTGSDLCLSCHIK